MTELERRALLPAGLRDGLPPEAAFEANTVERLLAVFTGFGYERVKPPLIEFEDSLLAGAGVGMSPHTFRLMDPVSQRMMGLRADMTPQSARIAAFRLGQAPRPLRLSYAGEVLRVKGDQLRPERQFGQVGAELIGSAAAAADSEVILMAAGALTAAGVEGLTVDLSLPALVTTVLSKQAVAEADRQRLRQALERRDSAAIRAIATPATDVLDALLRAAGPARAAIKALTKIALPREALAECRRMEEVVAAIEAVSPNLTITVDPVENRGFDYETGLCFVFFAPGVRGELGRGGRYLANGLDQATEPATGFSLFTDSVLRALPARRPPRRLYLPHGTPAPESGKWRRQGWNTVSGLDAGVDAKAEARRLKCTDVLIGADVVALD